MEEEKKNTAPDGSEGKYTVKDVDNYLTRRMARMILLCCLVTLPLAPFVAGMILLLTVPLLSKRHIARGIIAFVLSVVLIVVALVFLKIGSTYYDKAGMLSYGGIFPGDEGYEQVTLLYERGWLFLFGAAASGIVFALLTGIYTLVMCLKKVPEGLTADMEKVEIVSGDKVQKAFIKELRGYVNEQDAAAINAAIARENVQYENMKKTLCLPANANVYKVKDVDNYITRRIARLILLCCLVVSLIFSPFIAGIVLMLTLPFVSKRYRVVGIVAFVLSILLLAGAQICSEFSGMFEARGYELQKLANTPEEWREFEYYWELAGYLWFASIFCIGAFALLTGIYTLVMCLKKVPEGLVADINKVEIVSGRRAKKAFIKELRGYMRKKDAAAINAAIARENAHYDSLKDILYTPEEAEDVIARVYNMAVVVNGEADAKNLRKRMKALYEVRNFAEMRAIFAAFVPRYDEWIRANVHGVPAPFTPEMEGNGGFDGWVIQRWGWKILCGFVNVITLYLAKPFTICWMRRWECKHTVYKGKRLTFDGNGLQLWGKYIVWWLLCIVTLGIYTIFMPIRLEKWRAKHTHIAGEIAEFGGGFDGWVIQRLGWNILCKIVNAITLFIAYPATLCWKEKWYFKHRVYDGVRLRFNGKGIQLFGKWIQWLLLCVVTLGIYALFLPIRVEKWKAKHVTLSTYKEYWGGMFSGHRNPVDINAISVEAYMAEHAHSSEADETHETAEAAATVTADAPAAERTAGSYMRTPAYEGQTTEHYVEDTEAMHDDGKKQPGKGETGKK